MIPLFGSLLQTAYTIRRPGLRMDQGQMFQMAFSAPSNALEDIKVTLFNAMVRMQAADSSIESKETV